jgi:protein-S-isoprenylcysteine O-methyltransferase Ste14
VHNAKPVRRRDKVRRRARRPWEPRPTSAGSAPASRRGRHIVTVARVNPRQLSAMLDWLERGVLLGFYGFLVFRVLVSSGATDSLASLVVLLSEGLVVLLVLIRVRTVSVSRRPGDWLLAMSATAIPCLVQPAPEYTLLSPLIGAELMFMGILIQVHAKIVLGRSFGCVPAHRGLKLSGPYRFVRHPMYAGYLLTHVAFLLVNFTFWNLAVYALCYSLQIPRLLAEERLLRVDTQYAEYARRVRWRLVPGVF